MASSDASRYAHLPSALAWIRRPDRRADALIAVLFLAPSLFIFCTFIFFPLAYTFWLSFHKWNMIKPARPFIGLANYQRLFTSPDFWHVLRNTAVYTAGAVSLTMVTGLVLALLLNRPMANRALYRAAIFSPTVTATVAVAMLWLWIFDPQYGLMNELLRAVHLPRLQWLGDPFWALPALIIMGVWKFAGYDMVIFLAGLQNIPQELYEAAKIDGANGIDAFRMITLPLLTPTTFFLLTVSIISSFQVFDQIFVMTQGGPINSTNVFVYYLYQNAFKFFEAGYASSIAVVFFAIIMMLTFVQTRLANRWVHYA